MRRRSACYPDPAMTLLCRRLSLLCCRRTIRCLAACGGSALFLASPARDIRAIHFHAPLRQNRKSQNFCGICWQFLRANCCQACACCQQDHQARRGKLYHLRRYPPCFALLSCGSAFCVRMRSGQTSRCPIHPQDLWPPAYPLTNQYLTLVSFSELVPDRRAAVHRLLRPHLSCGTCDSCAVQKSRCQLRSHCRRRFQVYRGCLRMVCALICCGTRRGVELAVFLCFRCRC